MAADASNIPAPLDRADCPFCGGKGTVVSVAERLSASVAPYNVTFEADIVCVACRAALDCATKKLIKATDADIASVLMIPQSPLASTCTATASTGDTITIDSMLKAMASLPKVDPPPDMLVKSGDKFYAVRLPDKFPITSAFAEMNDSSEEASRPFPNFVSTLRGISVMDHLPFGDPELGGWRRGTTKTIDATKPIDPPSNVKSVEAQAREAKKSGRVLRDLDI